MSIYDLEHDPCFNICCELPLSFQAEIIDGERYGDTIKFTREGDTRVILMAQDENNENRYRVTMRDEKTGKSHVIMNELDMDDSVETSQKIAFMIIKNLGSIEDLHDVIYDQLPGGYKTIITPDDKIEVIHTIGLDFDNLDDRVMFIERDKTNNDCLTASVYYHHNDENERLVKDNIHWYLDKSSPSSIAEDITRFI